MPLVMGKLGLSRYPSRLVASAPGWLGDGSPLPVVREAVVRLYIPAVIMQATENLKVIIMLRELELVVIVGGNYPKEMNDQSNPILSSSLSCKRPASSAITHYAVLKSMYVCLLRPHVSCWVRH